MTSKIFFILLSIIISSCTSNSSKESIDIYGNDFLYSSVQSISYVIKNANEFIGKEIVVEGQIMDVCPMKGCWIEIKEYDSEKIMRVKVQDDVIVFPQSAKNKKAIVNGIFTKIEFSEDEAKKWKIHLAEEKGVKISEKDITLVSSDLIEYRIKGLGTKIISKPN